MNNSNHHASSSEQCAPESSLLSKRLIAQMEGIALTLPDNHAYITALTVCPELIEKESKPIHFLRFCGNMQDPDAAAKRLVGYWKLRLDTFGPERFSRPIIDLSGNGALTVDAAKILNEGLAYLLPPSKNGSVVICCEYCNTPRSNKKLGDFTVTTKFQVIFFLVQLCCLLPEASIPHGVIVVHIVKQQRHTPSPGTLQFLRRISQDGFPFVLRKLHYLLVPRDLPKKKHYNFSHNAIPYMSQMMEKPLSFLERQFDFRPVERDDSPPMQRAKIGLALVDGVGLLPGSLPEPAGGPWTYNRMMQELKSPHGLRVYSEIQPDPVFNPTVAKDLSGSTKKDDQDQGGMKELMSSHHGVSIYSDYKPLLGSKVANDLNSLIHKNKNDEEEKDNNSGGDVQQEPKKKNPLSLLADAAALLALDEFENQYSLLTYLAHQQNKATTDDS